MDNQHNHNSQVSNQQSQVKSNRQKQQTNDFIKTTNAPIIITTSAGNNNNPQTQNKQQLYIIPDQQINKNKEQIKPNRKQDPSPQTYHVYQKDSKKDNLINYSVILDEQKDQLNKTSQSAIRQGLKSASLRKQQSDNAPNSSENNKLKINKGMISNVKQVKEQQIIAKSQISQDFQVYQNQIMNKSDLTNNQGPNKIGSRNIPQTNSNSVYYKDSRRVARGGSGIDVETSMSQGVNDRNEFSIIRKDHKEMRTSSATAGPTTDEFGLEGQKGYNFIKKGNFMTNEANNTLYGGLSIPTGKPSQAYEGSLFEKSSTSANNQNINGKMFNAENFHENF